MLRKHLDGYPTVVMAVLHCYKHLVPHVTNLEDLKQLKSALDSIDWDCMCSPEDLDDSWADCQRQWQGRTDDGDDTTNDSDEDHDERDYVDLYVEVLRQADAQVVSASREPSTHRSIASMDMRVCGGGGGGGGL
jgi:hypothetical protein